MNHNTYHPSEVVWVELGTRITTDNPTGEVRGHEQANRRPCIVVQAFNHLKMLIVVPMTTHVPNNSQIIPYIVAIPAGAPQSKPSYALCHQIKAISFERVDKKIGNLESRDFHKLKKRLKNILNL